MRKKKGKHYLSSSNGDIVYQMKSCRIKMQVVGEEDLNALSKDVDTSSEVVMTDGNLSQNVDFV